MVNKKTILKIILAILAVPALIAAILGGYVLLLSSVFTSGDIPHRSDEDLIANFQSPISSGRIQSHVATDQ